MCLASPSTTRRGLYVAVTRGSDENVICVITDSDDIAEARDILDGIVAIDRADIPAVTQRRTLAQQLRDHERSVPAPPAPRCVIPDWFPSLLDDARNDLAVAEERETARAAQRQRLVDAFAAAGRTLEDVAAATAPDRDAYAAAAARADDARRQLATAQRRLDAAPRRARRSLRHDLDVAERRLERADAYLERTRQRTEPSIEQYRLAQAQRRNAHDNLRHRDTADLLDAMQHPVDVHRQRVAALETWQQWAIGGNIRRRQSAAGPRSLDQRARHQPHVDESARRQPAAVGYAPPRCARPSL